MDISAPPRRIVKLASKRDIKFKWNHVFIIFGFILLMGGGVQILGILRGEDTVDTTSSLANQIIYLSLYAVTLFFLILSRRRMSLGITRGFWFWLLLTWTLLSVFWSGVPTVTLRNVMALFGTTLFAFYAVKHLDIQEYIKLLAISLLILIFASYICIFLFPRIGIAPFGASEWRGVFLHKNILALTANLSLLIFCYLILTIKRGRWIWVMGVLAAAGLIIGSRSAGGIIIALFLAMLILTFYLMHKAPLLLGVILIGLIISIFVFQASLPSADQVLEYFGKDETLTGRTLIWDFCIRMALRKPWLGYGYGGFWLGSAGPSVGLPSEVQGNILSAHNGFIEIFLILGVIGLFIFLMVCWTAIQRSASLLFRKKFEFKYAIYLMILIFILAYNLTENTFLLRNNFLWVLLSSIIFFQSRNKQLTR